MEWLQYIRSQCEPYGLADDAEDSWRGRVRRGWSSERAAEWALWEVGL